MENKIPDFSAMGKALFNELARDVARIALAHFNESFEKEGFSDSSFIAWPKRSSNDLSFKLSHKLLSRSGSLHKSLRISHISPERVEIEAGGGLPYAAIHNHGGVINMQISPKMRKYFWAMYYHLKAESTETSSLPMHVLKWKYLALKKGNQLSIKIPQRKYIGDSNILNEAINNHIALAIETHFNTLNIR